MCLNPLSHLAPELAEAPFVVYTAKKMLTMERNNPEATVSGTTLYLTKKKMTTANLATDWEIHGKKSGTNETPGQAFTMEWGVGRLVPHEKTMTTLFELGVIGYDQWQVTPNGGTVGEGLPASMIPLYSVHAVGFQANFLLPSKNASFFFKFEPEYLAYAHPQGRTLVFGGSWTWGFPNATTAKP